MIVKRLLTVFCFFCLAATAAAQINTWAKAPGGLVRKVKVMNNAVYACGGNFFAKYSLTGNLIWIVSLSGVVHGFDMTLSNGNVYVTGFFSGSVNFNPQGNTILTSNAFDVFIAKYSDADGSYLYANSFGGASSDVGNCIEADVSGNIYVGGEFAASVNFDISGGNNTVNTNDNQNVKGFFAKYSQTSPNTYALAWVNTYKAADVNEINGSDVYASAMDENAGLIFITGNFGGTNTSFNPSVGDFVLSPTKSGSFYNRNAFIASYVMDSGKCVAAKNLVSPNSSGARDISLYNGDIYIVGDLFANTITSVNFDLNGGDNTRITTGGRDDIFFAKYNASTFDFGFANIIGSGTTVPAQPSNGPLQRAMAGNGIDVNSSGVYITGGFMGTIDLDPGIGVSNFTASGSYRDIFFGRYSLAGSYLGAQKLGASGDDAGYSIAATDGTDIYLGGLIGTNNTDVDPGPGTILMSGPGFLAGYSSSAVLPVRLSSFSAQVKNEKVFLQWRTTSELNNAGFTVQKYTGSGWLDIGFVKAQTNNTANEYLFIDIKKQSGTILYRLEQKDADGKTNLSDVLKVQMQNNKFSVVAYPNPVRKKISFNYYLANDASVVIEIIDANGTRMSSFSAKQTTGVHQQYADVSCFRKGTYYYCLRADERILSGQFIVE